MKKIAKLAVLLTAVSLFFVGCQNGVGATTDTEDTINVKTIKLATPTVKTVAYPGVNMLAWDRVEGAVKYLVVRDDGAVAAAVNSGEDFEFLNAYSVQDTDIANGINYKYTVWAIASTESNGNYTDYFVQDNSGAGVKDKLDIYDYVELKSSKKTVSVKGLVPDYTNEALDICKYESKPNKKYVVNSKNITVKRVTLMGRQYVVSSFCRNVDLA